MSTKIYDAYKLPADTDLFSLPALLHESILPARLAAEAQAIALQATQLVDRYSLYKDVNRLPCRPVLKGKPTPLYDPEWPWYSAIQILAERERNTAPSSVTHDSLRFELALVHDPVDDSLLAKAFTSDAAITQTFKDFAQAQGWSDWHYQDSADQPEDLSEAQWQQRRDSWDRALGPMQSFSHALMIDVKPPQRYGTAPQVLGMGPEEEAALAAVVMPTAEQRLLAMYKELIFAQLIKRMNSKRPRVKNPAQAYFAAGSAIQRYRHHETSFFAQDLAKIRPISVETINNHSGKEPVISHDLDESQMSEHAEILLADFEEVAGPAV